MPSTDLVLIPGLICDAALWAHQTKHLAELGKIAVAETTGGGDLGDMAHAVLAAAPARFGLAGFSMGGYIALEIMRRAPQRVDRLALIDTSARADSPKQSELRRQYMAQTRAGTYKGVTPRLARDFVHPDQRDNTALIGTITKMAENLGPDVFLAQQEAIMGRPDSRPGLGAIDCPTSVLVGREDTATPPEVAQEMADHIPGAHLVVIEQSGHMAPLEQPQAVTALLRTWWLYQ